MDEIWFCIFNENNIQNIKQISLENILELAPDTEDFSSLFTSMAGDVVASIIYTIEALLNPEDSLEKLTLVSNISFESIYQYLLVVNDTEVEAHVLDKDFESSVFQYPLMTRLFERW